jgi:hypothetical protein
MRLAVQLPPSENINEWLSVNSECALSSTRRVRACNRAMRFRELPRQR